MRAPLVVLAGLVVTLGTGVATVAAPPSAPGPVQAVAETAPTPVPVPPTALPTPPTALPTRPTALSTPSSALPSPPTPPVPAAPTPRPRRGDLSAYRGLGTWLDAYDWAPEYGGTVRPAAVDEMARRGVRTLYLQAAKQGLRSRGDLLSPSLLGQFLTRAHARGMQVQAWYLPTLDDLAADRRRLDAVLAFRASGQRFDTVGLDIEWRNGVPDVAERNRRLVALSQHLRRRAPDLPLSAIVVAPVVTEDVNRRFWRPFPWRELRPLYDVWQPMGYWTDRARTSRWADAYTSTQGNIRLLRRNLGVPDAPVHPIGGVGATDAAARGFVRAAREERALGGSLYDWPTTPAARYGVLRGVPR